jgi:23S rRNA (uracil1939-C5)-methyltransferase
VADNATALVFRNLQPLDDHDQQQLITFAEKYALHIYLQPQGPESIYRIHPTNSNDNEFLYYRLPQYNLELDFHPTQFIQINGELNQKMIAHALELLELNANDRVLDLFCGLGNFTLPMATVCKEIIGVEGDSSLIQLAQHNAAKNNISNAQFYTHDLTTDFSHAPWAKQSFDKILLDPPRTGALETVQQIIKLKPKKIVYVSCNPATLARDSKELIQAGYKLNKAGVMDMFPQTHHIEAIAVFGKH